MNKFGIQIERINKIHPLYPFTYCQNFILNLFFNRLLWVEFFYINDSKTRLKNRAFTVKLFGSPYGFLIFSGCGERAQWQKWVNGALKALRDSQSCKPVNCGIPSAVKAYLCHCCEKKLFKKSKRNKFYSTQENTYARVSVSLRVFLEISRNF